MTLVLVFTISSAFSASLNTIQTKSIVIVRAAKGVLIVKTRPIIIQAGKTKSHGTISAPTLHSNTSNNVSKIITTRSIVIVHAANGILKINTKPIILQAKNISTRERATTPNPPSVVSDGIPKSVTTKPMFIVHATNGILKINTGPIILQAKNMNQTTPANSLSETTFRIPKSISTRAIVLVRAENGILKINTKPIIIKAK